MTRLCQVILGHVTLSLVAFSLESIAIDTRAEEKVARVGVVHALAPGLQTRGFSGFWARLKELGWVRGQNLIVEELTAAGQPERFPQLMKEMLGRHVDVIVTGSTPAALAAKNATSTVPIVVTSMGDPVGAGLVSSLARPGGNLTGLSTQATDGLPGKWLELMGEALPGTSSVGVIYNPHNRLSEIQWNQLQEAALSLRLKVIPLQVTKAEDLAATIKRARATSQAALVLTDPLTHGHRREMVAAAAKYRVPTMYTMLEFADDGGLMAHGVDHTPMARRAADYVDKVLRGTSPGDLPIEQAGEFKIVVNLKTARALGIAIPDSVLLRSDELIR